MTENGANPPSKRLGSPFEYQPRSSFKNKTFAPTSGTSSSSDDDFVWSPAKMEEISDRLDEVHIESPLPRFDPFTYTAPGRNWSRAPGTALYPSKTPENLLSTEEKVLEMEREAKDKESRLQRARRERDHLRLAMTTDPVRRVFKAPTEANDIVLSPVPCKSMGLFFLTRIFLTDFAAGFTQGPLSGINNSVASFLNGNLMTFVVSLNLLTHFQPLTAFRYPKQTVSWLRFKLVSSCQYSSVLKSTNKLSSFRSWSNVWWSLFYVFS
jgi:hypothetical protein